MNGGGEGASMIPVLLCLLLLPGDSSMFHVTVTDDNLILISLEESDVMSPASVYVVKITGESKNYFFQFEQFNSSLPTPLVFNASYHGLYYIITLMVINANLASRPARSITVLTKPLPVTRVLIHDYEPSPETGVVFEVHYPEKFNVFTRVNISYWEGSNFRTMLYKDFFKGKSVFNHWLPGTCYRDVTFQLVSEASFNKSTLVESSGIGHTPQQHRTAPFPPRNISIQILLLNQTQIEDPPGGSAPPGIAGSEPPPERSDILDEQFESSAAISSYNWSDYRSSDHVTTSRPYWWGNDSMTADGEGFVNEIPPDYDNQTLLTSSEDVQDQPAPPRFRLLVNWIPPKPPTAYDGFNIYLQRDENTTDVSTVDENTQEYITELKDPGKYKVTIRSFSSSGSCAPRESHVSGAVSFYISPEGKWFEEVTERPVNVTVNALNSTAALVLWASSLTTENEFLVSVKSQTCKKQKESQRVERRYCEEVNISSHVIRDLVPGAQYQVVVYLQKAPLLGPPSLPVSFSMGNNV